MILRTKEEVLNRVADVMSEYLDTRDFGEFGVTVTVNHGRVVRLTRIDRENVVNYGCDKVLIEK